MVHGALHHPRGGSRGYQILCNQSASQEPCPPPAQLIPEHSGSWPLRVAWAFESGREGPLERHQVQTCFAWHGPPWAAPASQLPAWPRQGAKQDASDKTPARGSRAWERRVLEGGHLRPPAALLREGLKISPSSRSSCNKNLNPKCGRPSTWHESLLHLASCPNHFVHVLKMVSESRTKQIMELFGFRSILFASYSLRPVSP